MLMKQFTGPSSWSKPNHARLEVQRARDFLHSKSSCTWNCFEPLTMKLIALPLSYSYTCIIAIMNVIASIIIINLKAWTSDKSFHDLRMQTMTATHLESLVVRLPIRKWISKQESSAELVRILNAFGHPPWYDVPCIWALMQRLAILCRMFNSAKLVSDYKQKAGITETLLR